MSATQATPAFCPNCGVALGAAKCAACGNQIPAGARFCHHCGANAPGVSKGPDARRRGDALPWVMAAIAMVFAIGLAASQRFRATEGGEGAAPVTMAGRGVVPAPDISSLTPAQRAERLYDRVMGAAERGRDDSVRFFLPMAVGAYEALGELSVDQRYDLGRLAEVGGDSRIASAQADTILRQHPQHLLGLILAANAARLRGDSAAARGFLKRLSQNEQRERQRQLPEYLVHQNDIDIALGRATQPRG